MVTTKTEGEMRLEVLLSYLQLAWLVRGSGDKDNGRKGFFPSFY